MMLGMVIEFQVVRNASMLYYILILAYMKSDVCNDCCGCFYWPIQFIYYDIDIVCCKNCIDNRSWFKLNSIVYIALAIGAIDKFITHGNFQQTIKLSSARNKTLFIHKGPGVKPTNSVDK